MGARRSGGHTPGPNWPTFLTFASRYIDWPYIQHPTPYPRTPMTQEFRDRGLIVDEDVSHYDGTTAVVKSEHLAAEEIEFLRWKAERWWTRPCCGRWASPCLRWPRPR